MSVACNTGDQLVSPKEMISAIELMFRRMETIDNICSNEFPLYSPENNNTWTTSPGGSWMGGFWSACWWLRAKITESAFDQRKASAICQRLAAKTAIDSGYRSLIFWYGAGLGEIWFRDAQARVLAQESMTAIALSFNSKLNCIPLGTAMGGGGNGNEAIAIDNFAALIQLLSGSQQNLHHCMAQRHAETMLAACRLNSGAFHSMAYFDGRGFQPAGQAGIWSRGQAWAMLGLSRAAARWGEPYLTYGRTACEYWQHSRPDPLAPNRLGQSSSCSDPSATVIASLAMLSFAGLLPDGEYWRTCAHRQISAIMRSQYFTGLQEAIKQPNNDQYDATSGIFRGCCYKTGQDKEELVESVWGNFFLMAVLCALTGFIEPGHC